MNPHIAVVGGGATGLSLAFFLQRAGARVTLFEAAPDLGGLSAATRFPEFTWDRFYHVVAPQDRALLALLDELGLGDQVRFTQTRQGIFLEGAVRPLNGAFDLLRLPGLTLIDKLRLGLMMRSSRRAADSAELDRQTAAAWLQRRCGARTYDRLWRHLLRAKLGDAADTTAARFMHGTLQRLGNARRSSGGGERFGYVPGGYRAVLQRLEQRLLLQGAALQTGTAVTAVQRDGPGVAVHTARGLQRFDRAVLTLPNPQLAAVAADLSARDRERLGATPYLGVVCTVAIGRTPLSPYYMLSLCDDRLELTGILELSNVVDRQHTAGRSLVYLPRYAMATSPLFTASDGDLAAAALRDLRAVLPAADGDWLLHTAVHRARLIQPLPLAGGAAVAPPRVLVPGAVYCVNNAQLPTCVLDNSDCVALCAAAVADVLA